MKREQGDQVDGPPAGSGQSQGHSGPRHSDSGSQGSKSQGSVSKLHRTRTSIMWVTTLVGLVVLAFLLVFILQNLDSTRVDFLGFSGSLPLAVAMLFSAIGGAGLVGLLAIARMIQLRRAARPGRSGKH